MQAHLPQQQQQQHQQHSALALQDHYSDALSPPAARKAREAEAQSRTLKAGSHSSNESVAEVLLEPYPVQQPRGPWPMYGGATSLSSSLVDDEPEEHLASESRQAVPHLSRTRLHSEQAHHSEAEDGGRGTPRTHSSAYDEDDESDFFDEHEDLSANAMRHVGGNGVMMQTAGPGRRRSYASPSPTANPAVAIPGLAADDLPGAKARKVLGLDADGWEIGPGASEAAETPQIKSTSRRATARMTALLSGGNNHSSSSSSAYEGVSGAQSTSAASASSSSRRHSLLPAMLSLASRRPSVAPAVSLAATERQQTQAYSQQAHPNDAMISPGNTAGPSGEGYLLSSVGSGGPQNPSYFPVTPAYAALQHVGSSSVSPRTPIEATSFAPSSNTPTLASSSSSTSASTTVKGLRKGRSRKQQAATGPEEGATPTIGVGINTISAEDEQDWERALENAERNASWYSSIAHRPRPRPLPTGQPSKATGTPVPRAGSTSSASSTPTTDRSQQSLFHGSLGTSGSGALGRHAVVHTSAGLEGNRAFGLGIGGVPVRRSASTSNLQSSAWTGDGLEPALSPTGPPPEQQEELLDDGSNPDVPEGRDGFVGGGLSPSTYTHLQVHGSLDSPTRTQGQAGPSPLQKGVEILNKRSPGVGTPASASAHYRFSPGPNVVGSPDRFGQSYGSPSSGSRSLRYSAVPNGGSAAGASYSTHGPRPRRPSHDPHPLPPSLVGVNLAERGWDRRPSLGNEILTSAPGWGLMTDADVTAERERARSGSFGSAATPAALFAAGRHPGSAAVAGEAAFSRTVRAGAEGESVVGTYRRGDAGREGDAASFTDEASSRTPVVDARAQFATPGGHAAARPTSTDPGPVRASRSSKEGLITLQLDQGVQEGLASAIGQRSRDSTDAGRQAAVQSEGARERDTDTADETNSTQDSSERESVLVSDTEMDGALGRAFRLYSEQMDGHEPGSSVDASAARSADAGRVARSAGHDDRRVVTGSPHTPAGTAAGRQSYQTPRATASASMDSTTPVQQGPASACEKAGGVPILASGAGVAWNPAFTAGGDGLVADELQKLRVRGEDLSPGAEPDGRPDPSAATDNEGDVRTDARSGASSAGSEELDDERYLEMYARGLPSDMPRPVSVYSGSLGSHEGENEENGEVDVEADTEGLSR